MQIPCTAIFYPLHSVILMKASQLLYTVLSLFAYKKAPSHLVTGIIDHGNYMSSGCFESNKKYDFISSILEP